MLNKTMAEVKGKKREVKGQKRSLRRSKVFKKGGQGLGR